MEQLWEAMGGGPRGNGKKRAGLVRALMAHQSYTPDARHWAGEGSRDYRMTWLAEGTEKLQELTQPERSRGVAMSKMLRCRVRNFSDGSVLGSRAFVEGVFKKCRSCFGPGRTSGARKLRGNAAAAAGTILSVRDLQKGIG
ncbi:MAG: hypothetical protein NTW21_37795 [Verrucomicrobia bacterium]|nr:hypothetical protein [Verrucomicrobiota bacterium]